MSSIKERIIKKKKRLTKEEYWRDFTYGAWYLQPHLGIVPDHSKRKGRDRSVNLCKSCNKVYSIDHLAKPPTIYYYREIPKRGKKIKKCRVCRNLKSNVLPC